jgi:hypothetical protein
LGVEGRDDVVTLGRLGGTSVQFRADAGQVGPLDQWDGRVGLLGEAARDVRDGDIDTDGDGGGVGGGNEIDHHVEGTTLGVVGDPVLGLALNVIDCPGKASKRGEEKENRVQSITDVIVKGWFTFFGKATGKEMVTMDIAGFVAKGARGGGVLVEKRHTELATKEKAIGVGGKAMVGETTGEGVHGHTSGRGEEGGEDVQGGWVKGVAALEKGRRGQMLVELALETSGRGVEDKGGSVQGAWGGEEVLVVGVEEGGEVVTKGGDEGGGVAGGLPRGKPFGVDGGKLVDRVAITVRDTLCGVAKGADEGDEEGRECRVGGIPKAKAPLGHREEGKVASKE